MVIYRTTVADDTLTGTGLGYILLEGNVGNFSFDIRQTLGLEALEIIDGVLDVCWAIWSVSLYVPNPGFLVSGLSGNPNKYKFGQLSYRSVNATNSSYFWNYQVQAFQTQRCIVSPSNYDGYPLTPEEIPSFQTTGRIAPASSASNGLGFLVTTVSDANNIGFYGNTAFDIYAEESFEYTIVLTYCLTWGFFGTTPGGIYVFNQ